MADGSQLNVCMVSHSAALGGAERSLLDLVTQLTEDHGANCCVLLPKQGPLVEALRRHGADCIVADYAWWCSDPADRLSGDDKSARMRQSVRSMLDDVLPQLCARNPDVIWTQTLVVPWGALLAAIMAKPHVWSVREYGEKDHGLEFFWPFREVLADIAACSAFVFTANRAIAGELFPMLPPERTAPLYGSVVMPAQDGAAQSCGLLQTDGIRLGMFAKLGSSKGQEDAIAAVAALTRRSHKVELLLAGEASRAQTNALAAHAAQLQIADRVRFTGFLDNPYPAMRDCDIVVVCSRNEGFGRVVVEAMLLEKPVVYAAAGGMLETMIDGESGLGYPPGDVERLAGCLERLIADPSLRRGLGRRGREYALRRFGRDAYGGTVFRKLVELRDAPVASGLPRLLAPELIGALADTNHDLDMARQARDRLLAQHSDLAKRLDNIAGSTSWRVTAPLRAARIAMERLIGRN